MTTPESKPDWWQIDMLAAACKSGNPGAITLAAQLAGCPPCETCGYVKSHCRCPGESKPDQEKGGMPALPETTYQLYYEWPDDDCGYGGSEVVDGDAFTTEQMHAYAREYAAQEVAKLRADGARYRAFIDCGLPICFLGEEFRDKPSLDAAIAAIRSRKDTP